MPTVEIRGCAIAQDVLTSEATGAPLIWAHGLTSSRANEDAFPLIDTARLCVDRPVCRYDARGHGESGDLTQPAEGSWAELSRDQVALIDHLGWENVVLGGASMGAATALHAALALGTRVEALILVIPPTGWETRADQTDLYEQMAGAVEAHGTAVLEAGVRLLAPPDPFLVDDVWTERRVATLRAADPTRLAAAFRGAGTAELPSREAVASIAAPTLILAWSGDTGHPVSTAEQLGELLPHSDVVVSSTLEDFGTWTTRCAEFLDGC